MSINAQLLNTLDAIKEIESPRNRKLIDVAFDQVGGKLIELYYVTGNLRTRELIWSFMQDAGEVWLQKLVTRDALPCAISRIQLASMDDYLGLLASNDDSTEFLRAS